MKVIILLIMSIMVACVDSTPEVSMSITVDIGPCNQIYDTLERNECTLKAVEKGCSDHAKAICNGDTGCVLVELFRCPMPRPRNCLSK
jgi:hypothetical protein